MKRSLVVISMLMLVIGSLECDYFQRKLNKEIGAKIEQAERKSSNEIVAKVEQFKKLTGHLPEALPDIGLKENEIFPCYCKTSNDSYMVWYPTDSDSYEVYNSRTKQWSKSRGGPSGSSSCHAFFFPSAYKFCDSKLRPPFLSKK